MEEIEQEARDALEALRTAKGTVRLLDTYRAVRYKTHIHTHRQFSLLNCV